MAFRGSSGRKSVTFKRGTSGARPTIGLVITHLSRSWTIPQWGGVLEGARRRDANVITFAGSYLLSKNANDAQANIIYDLAKSERLDGLVIWTGGLDSLVTPAELAEFADGFRPVPMVVVEHPIEGVPSLVLDDYEAMREMMTHLIEVHRYRSFAYIQSSSTAHYGIATRYRAFTETLAEHGIPFDPRMVSPPFFFETRENSPGLSEWVRRLPRGEKVAIVGHNDIAALGMLEVINSLGLRVPQDLALVGYDDIDECSSVTPPLTTMRPPFRELGMRAAETLIDMIEGKSVPELTCLPTPLVHSTLVRLPGCLGSQRGLLAGGRGLGSRGGIVRFQSSRDARRPRALVRWPGAR